MAKSVTSRDLRPSELTLKDFAGIPYNPSNEINEYLQRLKSKFEEARRMREKPYSFLGDRSAEQYWRDSENRWLGNLPTSRKKPWQSRVVKPVTRNRCIGIIAHLLSALIEPQFFARKNGVNSTVLAQSLSDLGEIAKDLDRYTLKYLLTLVDAVTYGTAYIQKDYVRRKRTVKDIIKWDPITGETQYTPREITDFDGFLSSVISPFEVYLGDFFTFEMDKQPYLFRRTVVPYSIAKGEFGNYPDWKYIMPGNYENREDQDSKFSRPFNSADVTSTDVEILRYQCTADDEIAVVINGVLMTPIGSPIPYTHKDYNLVKVVFEPISPRCAIGKSAPDRLMGEQDVIDTLYRMIIDKTYLSLFPPLLSLGREKITSSIIEPGLVTPADTESDVRVPTGVANGVGNEVNILSFIEKSMDQSSIDREQLGVSATGERSATQVLEARAGAQKVLGLFAYMISFMLEDSGRLDAQNYLQFWSYLTDKFFEATDRTLRNGSTGSRIIKFAYKKFHPSSREILQMETASRKKGKNVEFIYLDPDEIRAFEISVRVKANPTERLNPAMEKALGIEFYDKFISNPFMEPEKLTRETVRLFKRNPDDVMKTAAQQQVGAAPQLGAPEGAQGSGGPPGAAPFSVPPSGNLTQQLQGMLQPKLKSLVTER